MKDFYTVERKLEWRGRMQSARNSAIFIALGALIGCILICLRVKTVNAETSLETVIVLSILAGWAVILLIAFGYLPAKAEARHIEGMLAEEAAEVTGVLTVDRQKWQIPGSIAFCRATIADGAETHACHVDAALLRALPENGTRIRAVIRRKFITAWEVQHEEA